MKPNGATNMTQNIINSSIIEASNLIALIDPAMSKAFLSQPFHRHALVTAFYQSLLKSATYRDRAEEIAVRLRSAIDTTECVAA